MNGLLLHPQRLRSVCAEPIRLLRLIRNSLLTTCVVGAAAVVPQAQATGTQATESAAVPASHTPAHDPANLIDMMSEALTTLTYEGVFVHAQGRSLASMQILHASNERGEFERLSALDGEAREVIRNNSLVTCIWPDSQSVVISKTKPRELLPRIDSTLAVNPRYRFSLGQPDRVAGRSTHVVKVQPRDEFGYGYRFWIDVENSMLLRSMLLDQSGLPIEQVIFTHIEYPDHIDISRFDILYSGKRSELVSWLEPSKAIATSSLEQQTSEVTNRISFSALPEGYRKMSETSSSSSVGQGALSHAMISDGMASVSVYVEFADPDSPLDGGVSAELGLSRMGAMNAYSIRMDNSLITAVGEVPEATVRAIAAAVVVNE